MKTIITTVGTSLISNFLEANPGVNDFQLYSKNSYKSLFGMENEVEELVQRLVGFWGKKPEDSCAEITTIAQYHIKNSGSSYRIKLLASDTALSYICARAIENLLRQNTLPCNIEEVEVKVIGGLNVNRGSKLDYTGFTYLFAEIRKEVFDGNIHDTGRPKVKKDVIINFSGGFKGVIPYLTMFAQLYDLPLIYCFDDSNNLISIRKSMLKFDWNLAEHLYPFLIDIRYEQLGQEDVNFVPALSEYKLINHNNGKIILSWFGAALLEYIEENMTTAKLPLSFMVEYKFLEYFSNSGAYYKPQRSVRLKSGEVLSPEFDIVLWHAENEIEVCEVKSIGYFMNERLFKEFLNDQFSRQISFIKSYTNEKISSYRLLIYGTEIDADEMTHAGKKKTKKNLEAHLISAKKYFLRLKEKTDELRINFAINAYPIRIGHNDYYETNNLYQNFYRTKLDKNNLIDYKIETTKN